MANHPAPPDIPGYELLHPLGEGGMATVYLAKQKSLDRKVAIKILRTVNDDDPERTAQRFLREGRTLAKITHRNVCGIYDIAKVGDVAYIAMEFLDGGTLVDRMRTGISVGESIAVAVQIASALQEAHNQGIVHRDLKPANVMMRGGKVPVITDFGIARELTSNQTKITVENMIVGTPVYMSPEQVSGGEIDGRSDVYSLGILFYELITGYPPYKGDNPIQLCMQHLTAPVPQLGEEFAELNPVLAKLLAKKREDRYASMSDFTHALRDVFVQSPSLRTKAELAPNQAWTEQLRQMGFSFDTLRDAELNSKLRQQQSAQPPVPVTQQVTPRVATEFAAPASAAPIKRTPWGLIAASVLALCLVAGGAYYFANRGTSKTEQLAIKGLIREYETHVEKLEYFTPESSNAAKTLQEMQDIDSRSPQLKSRVAQFERLLAKNITELANSGQTEAAQKLFDQALATELFAENAFTDAQLTLSKARGKVENAEAISKLIAAVELKLKEPNSTLDVGAEFVALREKLDPAEPELKRLEQLAETRFAMRTQLALDNAQMAQLQALLVNWKAAVPDSILSKRYAGELAKLRDKQGFSEQIAAVSTQLSAASLGAGELGAIAESIRALMARKADAPQLPGLRKALIDRADLLVRTEIKANRLDQAEALVKAIGSGFEIELRQLSLDIAAAKNLSRIVELSGILLIDTQPAGVVLRIVDSKNVAMPLPRPANTPLTISLVEDTYKIEVQIASGLRKQFSGTVKRGTTSTANTGFSDASKAYLQDAGF